MYLQDRITSDPRIFDGQPYIRSTRLTVRDVVETLLTHRSCDHLLAEHPELDPEDVRAAAEFAALHLDPNGH